MLEQTCERLRAERLQRAFPVAPAKKEPRGAIYLESKRGSDHLPKDGKATDSSITNRLNAGANYNIKIVIAELEQRRAKLYAQARAAEARAQRAEEKREFAETRLEQETSHRLVAEATARAAEEKSHKIEALVLGAKAGDREATERNLLFGLLVFSNRRAEAIVPGTALQPPAQVEAEGMTQDKFEEARAAIELTMWKEGEFTSSNLLKSVDDDHSGPITGRQGMLIKLKFIASCTLIFLLVVAYWMLIAAFR